MSDKEDFLRIWATKPLYVFVRVVDDFKITTCDHIEIGKVISCQYSIIRGVQMRHIQVEATNGAHYHGRYGPAKRNDLCLKRCSDGTEAKKKSIKTRKVRRNFLFGKKDPNARKTH